MKPSLTPWADAPVARRPRPAAATMTLRTLRIPVVSLSEVLEPLPELEVQLPAWPILIEAIGVIQTQRTEGSDDCHAQAGAAQEAGRVDLARAPPQSAR